MFGGTESYETGQGIGWHIWDLTFGGNQTNVQADFDDDGIISLSMNITDYGPAQTSNGLQGNNGMSEGTSPWQMHIEYTENSEAPDIQNGTVTISPEPTAHHQENLNCTFTPVGSGSLTAFVDWYKNGLIQIQNDMPVTADMQMLFLLKNDDMNISEAETWSCAVRIFGGGQYSEWYNSTETFITNSRETNGNHTISHDLAVGNDLYLDSSSVLRWGPGDEAFMRQEGGGLLFSGDMETPGKIRVGDSIELEVNGSIKLHGCGTSCENPITAVNNKIVIDHDLEVGGDIMVGSISPYQGAALQISNDMVVEADHLLKLMPNSTAIQCEFSITGSFMRSSDNIPYYCDGNNWHALY
jgi:hypothetical protein